MQTPGHCLAINLSRPSTTTVQKFTRLTVLGQSQPEQTSPLTPGEDGRPRPCQIQTRQQGKLSRTGCAPPTIPLTTSSRPTQVARRYSANIVGTAVRLPVTSTSKPTAAHCQNSSKFQLNPYFVG